MKENKIRMRWYIITYHMGPFVDDIIVTFPAHDEEEAIIFAKGYRKDAFSIEEGEPVRFDPE